MKTFEEIQQEYQSLPTAFELMLSPILDNSELVELAAKHPLYEIEPFFNEHNNDFVDENSPSMLISSAEDFDPEKDDYYTLKVNLKNRKAYFRRLHLGGEVSYDTVYEYNEEYYKSATIYINPQLKKAIKLCYLFFKDGMPEHYIECTEYGTLSKKYNSEDTILLGYTMENIGTGYVFDVEFNYNYDGALDSIIESYRGDGRPRTLFKRPDKNENSDRILQTIEDHLVEEITEQIQTKVRIDEKVYCILLEYTMQTPFPPTIGIGVESEIHGDRNEQELHELYNAPDMKYFSESETIEIDLYTAELESAYLFVDRNFDIMELNDEEFASWSSKVKALYLRVCKRLMHMNFEDSFTKMDNFLVIARDFEECNEEDYYIEMNNYKIEKGL